MYRPSIPRRERYTELMAQVDWNSTQQSWSVSVSDSDAAKISCVNCEWRVEKIISDLFATQCRLFHYLINFGSSFINIYCQTRTTI